MPFCIWLLACKNPLPGFSNGNQIFLCFPLLENFSYNFDAVINKFFVEIRWMWIFQILFNIIHLKVISLNVTKSQQYTPPLRIIVYTNSPDNTRNPLFFHWHMLWQFLINNNSDRSINSFTTFRNRTFLSIFRHKEEECVKVVLKPY